MREKAKSSHRKKSRDVSCVIGGVDKGFGAGKKYRAADPGHEVKGGISLQNTAGGKLWKDARSENKGAKRTRFETAAPTVSRNLEGGPETDGKDFFSHDQNVESQAWVENLREHEWLRGEGNSESIVVQSTWGTRNRTAACLKKVVTTSLIERGGRRQDTEKTLGIPDSA